MHIGWLGYRDTEAVALDGDFTPSDGVAGCEDPELVSFLCIEWDHRTPSHPQQLLHGHATAAQEDGHLDIHVQDLVSI